MKSSRSLDANKRSAVKSKTRRGKKENLFVTKREKNFSSVCFRRRQSKAKGDENK